MPRLKRRGICKIYKDLLSRLPSTYPKPSLVVHSNLTMLNESFKDCGPQCLEDDISPVAYCDPEDYTVHVADSIRKCPVEQMVFYYLHEIGHLYALKRYGEIDPRWDDDDLCEQYADRFALRWVSRLKKERWI